MIADHPLSAEQLEQVLAQVRSGLASAAGGPAPPFREFAWTWFDEISIRWRANTLRQTRAILKRHLVPHFAETSLRDIRRVDLVKYQAQLARTPRHGKGEPLAAKTVNAVMGILKMLLAEGADRYGFPDPGARIKRLRVRRPDIEPFSLAEVHRILATVREDFQSYYTVRFFTGMRTGEIHGLRWPHVDFERRQILVRETYAHGKVDYTKNDGSQREIDMNAFVHEALREQHRRPRKRSDYVFCNSVGRPLDARNVVMRVWDPLLRLLKLRPRRPYQCRHTCATLWLASGENPTWIARQLGHTTPEMLFRVYSRFVPNLTRRDGSAFEQLLRDTRPGAAAAPPAGPAHGLRADELDADSTG